MKAFMSDEKKLWLGLTRETISWFTAVKEEMGIGSELGFAACEVSDHTAHPDRPYDCLVGGATCANIYPVQAITFPERQKGRGIEREHKVLAIVRKEAAAKHEKLDAQKARAAAKDKFAQATARAAMKGGRRVRRATYVL